MSKALYTFYVSERRGGCYEVFADSRDEANAKAEKAWENGEIKLDDSYDTVITLANKEEAAT